MTETPCPVCGAVSTCEHTEARQLHYVVPDRLKTPARPFPGAKRVKTPPTPRPPVPEPKR